MILIICWAISTVGAWFIANYAYKLGLIDVPDHRSSHSQPVPRGAGIGILAVFIFLSYHLQLPNFFWIPITILAAISFCDDRFSISPAIRLIIQLTSATFIVTTIAHSAIQNWTLYILLFFFILYIVGTANFYNFMDGINGIAGITGLVAFFLIWQFAFLNHSSNQWILFAASISVACLGLLPFNIPYAKVFMGDVGSVLIGFLFASVVVILSYDIISFIALSLFIFPFYADALTTMFIRFRNKEKLYHPHRKHLYQILANEYGYKHWIISTIYGIVQLATGELSIIIWKQKSLAGLFVLLFTISLLFSFITYKVRISIK